MRFANDSSLGVDERGDREDGERCLLLTLSGCGDAEDEFFKRSSTLLPPIEAIEGFSSVVEALPPAVGGLAPAAAAAAAAACCCCEISPASPAALDTGGNPAGTAPAGGRPAIERSPPAIDEGGIPAIETAAPRPGGKPAAAAAAAAGPPGGGMPGGIPGKPLVAAACCITALSSAIVICFALSTAIAT